MNKEKLKTWVQKIIRFLAAMIGVVLFFYVLVFFIGFVPNGYNIIQENGDQLTIKSYTILGMTEKIYEYTPGEEDLWTSLDIKRIINNEKWYYLYVGEEMVASSMSEG